MVSASPTAAVSAGALSLLLVATFALALLVLAAAERRARTASSSLSDVDGLMAREPLTLRASDSVEHAIEFGFDRQLFAAFPVVDEDGQAVGLVSFQDVRAVSAEASPTTMVRDVMCTSGELLVASGTPIEALLQSPAFAQRERAVVVGSSGAPVGLVSMTEVRRRFPAVHA